MSEHEVAILDANFETWTRERGRGLKEPFLYYVLEHLTKRLNLTDEVLKYGVTD
ncbi:MAG TPA: hypothetical protein VIJ79_06475 [Acidobacteriaceae bacterium]